MGGTRKPFSRRPHRYRRPPKRHFLQRPFPQRGTQERQKLHNYPYYNKYNKYDSKNKNNNKNNEKNDMERFDLGDVLSLPAPTPVGAPYPRDVTGVKGVAAFIRKLYAMVSAEEHPQ